MISLDVLVRVAGVMHFGLLLAGALLPVVLDWRGDLAKLSRLSRQIVWVHGVFIAMLVCAFGVGSIVLADSLTAGTPLARSLCGFIAVFWLARLALQLFVLEASPYLRGLLLKVGYHGLTVVFVYFVMVYGWVAMSSGMGVLP